MSSLLELKQAILHEAPIAEGFAMACSSEDGEQLCNYAAKYSGSHLIYLHETAGFMWGLYAYYRAVKHGKTVNLAYLLEKKTPPMRELEDLLQWALRYNNLAAIMLLVEKYAVKLSSEMTLEAAKAGQYNILSYLYTRGCKLHSRCCIEAATSNSDGGLDCLKFALSVGCKWDCTAFLRDQYALPASKLSDNVKACIRYASSS